MRAVYYLSGFIPIAAALDAVGAPATILFFSAALALIPLAALAGAATEQLAARAGPGVAGLLNVTFGNAPELIIALFALADGLQEVVKASLVGSVIGNSLLVLGAAMLAGGLRRSRQTFDRAQAQTQSGMLLITLAALVLPAVFQLAHGGGLPSVSQRNVRFSPDVEHISLAVAIILIATYAGGLVFSLKTHRDVFRPSMAGEERPWSARRSLAALAFSSALIAGMSAILVASIEHAARDLGLSPFFVGAFVVAIAGNAAEHYVAVLVAAKDKMDLAVNIAIGSSAQVALFVAPLLVLISFALGPFPMGLVFNGYEIAALVLAALIARSLAADGESTWFEGVQLLAVYAVLGVVFFFA